MYRLAKIAVLFDHHDVCPELYETKFGEGMSAEEHRSKTMPQDEKRKLLRELLAR